jgi:hypothetical protein
MICKELGHVRYNDLYIQFEYLKYAHKVYNTYLGNMTPENEHIFRNYVKLIVELYPSSNFEGFKIDNEINDITDMLNRRQRLVISRLISMHKMGFLRSV